MAHLPCSDDVSLAVAHSFVDSPVRHPPAPPQDLETKINDFASEMDTLTGEIATVKAELVDLTTGLQQVPFRDDRFTGLPLRRPFSDQRLSV